MKKIIFGVSTFSVLLYFIGCNGLAFDLSKGDTSGAEANAKMFASSSSSKSSESSGTSLNGKTIINGTVYYQSSGLAASNVAVSLSGGWGWGNYVWSNSPSTTTNSSGKYSLTIDGYYGVTAFTVTVTATKASTGETGSGTVVTRPNNTYTLNINIK
jgi:hypothetical protein